jgi:predicted molibdopterin-dependent oxidoreductase YjgC
MEPGRARFQHPPVAGRPDMLEARCESCGACVAYCPTGALDNKMSSALGVPDRKVTTTCTYCGVGCQFDLNVKDDREVIRVTSNPNAPVNGMHLCVKGRYGYDFRPPPRPAGQPKVRRYLLDGSPKPVRPRRVGGSRLGHRPGITAASCASPRHARAGQHRRAGLGQVH